jgi:hypothetical protein
MKNSISKPVNRMPLAPISSFAKSIKKNGVPSLNIAKFPLTSRNTLLAERGSLVRPNSERLLSVCEPMKSPDIQNEYGLMPTKQSQTIGLAGKFGKFSSFDHRSSSKENFQILSARSLVSDHSDCLEKQKEVASNFSKENQVQVQYILRLNKEVSVMRENCGEFQAEIIKMNSKNMIFEQEAASKDSQILDLRREILFLHKKLESGYEQLATGRLELSTHKTDCSALTQDIEDLKIQIENVKKEKENIWSQLQGEIKPKYKNSREWSAIHPHDFSLIRLIECMTEEIKMLKSSNQQILALISNNS